MRDMSQVLERWGGWARSDSSGVDYSSIAAGFKGLLPQDSKITLSCSDDDGLIIDSCLAKLKSRRPDEYELIVLHYLYQISKRKLARNARCDEKLIRIKLQMAEGFVDGSLCSLNAKLFFE
ncbi:antitermination protein Q [Pantoea sp. Mb-10]|uniref:antiterminator Q family protein n=1 Tax=unclassified Pantoea TaxID=2630326 RepID=UPI001E315684|nr:MULTISPECIES: antiterminator Q family protein [unclassified Pantoea]MCE0490973.1 antitermination protein Q [Pantoea sp. Mb-10]MCE0499869.1 antitermination protein Q [Pantoea sp. Pb-8]